MGYHGIIDCLTHLRVATSQYLTQWIYTEPQPPHDVTREVKDLVVAVSGSTTAARPLYLMFTCTSRDVVIQLTITAATPP